ncbi:hypothetical protein [Deinococcus sp.]|uniref:hypothetical protein n=1 Tax=Deinococcus sp. TaxID=47478 RepID=UPI0025C1D9EE|nr:hypothetical protein [Deinococcus sp.]
MNGSFPPIPYWWYGQLRALQLIDELHRVGFEQLRFARTQDMMHIRVYICAARLTDNPNCLLAEPGIQVVINGDGSFQLFSPDDANHNLMQLSEKWTILLNGTGHPRHLAGEFIMDFHDYLRPAYGADHEYRQWFRQLRPHLQQGRLPVMVYDSDVHSRAWRGAEHIGMVDSAGKAILLPAPPANPFIEVTR